MSISFLVIIIIIIIIFLGQVTAEDADSGQNGEVIYEIVSQFPGQPRDMFSINPKTGEIRTATTIDYEITTGVLLVIKATGEILHRKLRGGDTFHLESRVYSPVLKSGSYLFLVSKNDIMVYMVLEFNRFCGVFSFLELSLNVCYERGQLPF